MRQTTFFFLLLFSFSLSAQENSVYTASGTAVFLQIGTAYNDRFDILITDVDFQSFQSIDQQFDSNRDKSVSFGIGFERIRNNVGFRVEINQVNINKSMTFSNESSNSLLARTDKRRQTNYEIIPGLHRYYETNKWLISAGLILPISIYGTYFRTDERERSFSFISESGTFAGRSSSRATLEIPGGFGFGMGANVGIYYAINPTIRVGFNYAPIVYGYKVGGATETVTKTRVVAVSTGFIDEETDIVPFDKTKSELFDFRQKAQFSMMFNF